MSDFYIKVDASKHRAALRVPSRTDTASVSLGSSHTDPSLTPSTSATSVTSGRPASTKSRPTGIARQAPKPTRTDDYESRSPLQQLQQQAASLLDVAVDAPLNDSRANVNSDKGTVEGVWSRGRAAREVSREAAKHRSRRPSDTPKDPTLDDEINPVHESKPPAASQHTYQPRRRENRPECPPVTKTLGKVRRRSSLKMVKDTVGSLNTVARNLSTKKKDPEVPRSPNAQHHRLPTAAEVYGKPTYFRDCPHMSPPAHLPLNAVPRTLKLAPGLLRFPTPEHKRALSAMRKDPELRAPTVEVIDGLCATCDLTDRREQETAVLQAWNHKHDKFARRLVVRRMDLEREFHSGFAENALRHAGRESPIHALEDKLLKVNEQREIAVAAIWVGFKARWGVTPSGIICQKNKEKWEYGRTTPVQFPPRENEEAKTRDRASKTGFMHNGEFGKPMDHVDEPGRVRLQWHTTDVDLPKVPSDYKWGQGLEWTKEEYKLLEKDPWEKR